MPAQCILFSAPVHRGSRGQRSFRATRQIVTSSGRAVAIGAEFVIVGTTGRDTFKGVAYIYRAIEDFHPVEPSGLDVATLGQVERTALFQNFPNPFNPETWFPYRLASAAQVTLRIYNVRGQLLRALDLGLQQPGSYLSREHAAYWYGKDPIRRLRFQWCLFLHAQSRRV
ncbi:MAG: hypothetical protein OXN17_04755 [Candidatus Poribacteria bacterium]|nr:hypothetical protein [Candidatus Poribacteria bacterium]MDE0505144.1 hypothetical protein [Candidatus Poribacteria bacterium]